jgi:hypothetical protein
MSCLPWQRGGLGLTVTWPYLGLKPLEPGDAPAIVGDETRLGAKASTRQLDRQ